MRVDTSPNSTRAPTEGALHTDVLLVEDDDLVRYGLRLLASDGRVYGGGLAGRGAAAPHDPRAGPCGHGFQPVGTVERNRSAHLDGAKPAPARRSDVAHHGRQPRKGTPSGNLNILAKPFEGRELQQMLAWLPIADRCANR